jgi:hypothetical protein
LALAGGNRTLNNGHTLSNSGDATWTSGTIHSGSGAVFNNLAGATFTTDFDGSFSHDQGGTPLAFNNAGTFTKSGGNGSTNFSVDFNNTGTVNIDSGTLVTTRGFQQTAGEVILNGGDLSAGSNDVNIAGGSIRGNGQVISDLLIGDALLAPGLSTGQLSVDGVLTLSEFSELEIEILDSSDFDIVDVTGTVMLDGFLSVQLPAGPGSIQFGDTFTVMTTSGISGSFDNVMNGGILFAGGNPFRVHYGTGSAFDPDHVVIANAVPEPGSAALFLTALTLGAALCRRCR